MDLTRTSQLSDQTAVRSRACTIGTLLIALTALISSGCHVVPKQIQQHPACSFCPDSFCNCDNSFCPQPIPRELMMVPHPPYVIEPPDILLIDAVSIVPKGEHKIAVRDVVAIQVTPTFPEYPLTGDYPVEGTGIVNLGPVYGTVSIVGKTVDEAAKVIAEHLTGVLNEPRVSVSLVESAALQQVSGEHLVSQDGTVNLGVYGQVPVVGFTIDEAKYAIEAHLSQFLQDPRVAINVIGYNSKVYYVITEGAGLGDDVAVFPITGKETVLDAIARIEGLSQVSSKRIWIARPAPDSLGYTEVYPVDWIAITQGGATATNYQLMAGDRVFIFENKWDRFDKEVDRIIAPFERMFGFTLLGVQTIQAINRFPLGFGGNFINN